MKIENEFRVNAPIDVAWAFLTDIPAIAPCMPGAKLTSVEDQTYAGTIKVKVGPVTAEYSGTATFVEKDDTAHRLELSAKGRDSRGSGNADAVIVAQLTPDDDTTVVNIDTDLKISGKVAQFGRGVMVDVSNKLIGQFVECLEDKIRQSQQADAAPTGSEAGDAGNAGPTLVSDEDREVEALDLTAVAGGAMLKRIVPAVVAVVVVVVLWRVIF
ncbi:Carbon monoxide oxidation accessory protein CoxG [hydrothermal vent metagenome]|uniref:Carbon monoxide oxidation accessory protein CoxG n=1 Tax=hydrothermal vent metagenome TaxID=652676 RepID=A0A3B0SKN7_9ZZZZ